MNPVLEYYDKQIFRYNYNKFNFCNKSKIGEISFRISVLSNGVGSENLIGNVIVSIS
jgi:hypothetical protein